MTEPLTLILLPDHLAVCRFPADAFPGEWPEWAISGELSAVLRSAEEVSVVCLHSLVPEGVLQEAGWRALKVKGPLPFSMVGVLASVADPLAKAGVSIFALSTYDTDYVLVKEAVLRQAVDALCGAGHILVES
ncbi:MAG: ACT domain-containing protein [Anaerolineae bacterium]|nr:ACT domain-containing protein [Anaerolineae bacterium]